VSITLPPAGQPLTIDQGRCYDIKVMITNDAVAQCQGAAVTPAEGFTVTSVHDHGGWSPQQHGHDHRRVTWTRVTPIS
jgi:hypothetical protein